MKKITAILSVIALIVCVAVIFSACSSKDEDITTTPSRAGITDNAVNDGMVTDESESGDNGVLGDIVTDVSEGVSDIMTDVSEDASEIMD